jgi:protein-tyrosine phosphatase
MKDMIDTHLHILPGVDDGPETMQESLLLARVLVEEGIHHAIATPHYNDEFPHRSALEIRERVNEMQYELDRNGIPLRLYAGHEVLIKPGLVEDIQAGRFATLNGSRYLLLELWSSSWLPETDRVIFELQASGIIPILAHPERYHTFQKDPSRLASLIQRGVLAQVTVGSLLGMQGNTIRRTAETLLKKGLVHFLASDAHGIHKRPPAVAGGLRCAERLLGRSVVYHLVEVRPAAIIQNALCPV